MDPSRGDSRYNLNYSMSSIGLSLSDQADLYGNPAAAAALGAGSGRPPSGGLIQSMGGGGRSGGGNGGLMSNSSQCQSLNNNTGGSGQSRGIKRTSSDCYDDHHRGGSGGMTSQTLQGLESCGGVGNNTNSVGQPGGNVTDVVDDSYASLQNKKSPPANGKKTKGRVKIKMEYIDNKLRRYTTFSKRKTGIMKKAYELSTLTGTQVMLLVASETGHVYTFATRKLQPMITSEAGKQLIQTCLNSPDPPSGGGGGDQRMSATGFEETELSYNIADEDSKDDRSPMSSGNESDDSSDIDSPGPPSMNNSQTIMTDSPIQQETQIIGGGPSVSTHTHHQQQSQPAVSLSAGSSTTHYDTFKSNTNLAAQQSTINNVVYPASALANIPQEVLLGLVQSGHLQLHTEDDGSGHQYITIPLSMATVAPSSSNTTTATAAIGNSGGNGQNATNSTLNSRNHGKDLSTRPLSSTNSTSNGRENPSPQPQSVIRIKKELID